MIKVSVPDLTAAQVLVVGDVMLDRYWYGPAARISPEAPVPVVRVEYEEDRPGGAGNVALNVAALGGRVTLLALIGEDAAAQTLTRKLAAADVQCAFQQVANAPTITKLRVLSRHQQLLRMDFEQGFDGFDTQAFQARFNQLLDTAQAVVLSDYGKGTLREVQTLIAAARQAGCAVVVDPKGCDFSPYRGASLVTPNLAEFEAVVGPCKDEATLVQRGLELCQSCAFDALLITRGEHGMSLLRSGEPELHLPAMARQVYDVTGAGDTVVATLAAALAVGESLPQAVALANLAAGIVVGKLGTATVGVAELQHSLRHEFDAPSGVVDEVSLRAGVDAARARGERIVMTNGVFDILHAGHVSYLQQARQLGDRLLVAVNDDPSVQRLKGPGRPVNPLPRRMAVLAALQAVDWVVPFAEDTPARLIGEILPQVLVKGGDYRPDQVVGRAAVEAAGGRVAILPFEEGCSTTALIDSIRSSNDGPGPGSTTQ